MSGNSSKEISVLSLNTPEMTSRQQDTRAQTLTVNEHGANSHAATGISIRLSYLKWGTLHLGMVVHTCSSSYSDEWDRRMLEPRNPTAARKTQQNSNFLNFFVKKYLSIGIYIYIYILLISIDNYTILLI